MEIIKMKAEERQGTGKSVAARLRRGGHIPAVAYGKGANTLHLAVSPKELLGVLKSEHGKNSVVELGVTGNPLTVLVRDYSYHPVSRDLLHVDFIQIKLDQEVDVEVPFVTTGKCVGITAGGQLRIVFRSLPIRCLPEKIPTRIEHDVTNVGLNEAVHAADLKLPAGVSVRLPAEQTVASVVAPEREKAEDAAAAAAPAAAAGKAAPAAAAKPDAKKKLSVVRLFAAWALPFGRAFRPFAFVRGASVHWRAASRIFACSLSLASATQARSTQIHVTTPASKRATPSPRGRAPTRTATSFRGCSPVGVSAWRTWPSSSPRRS